MTLQIPGVPWKQCNQARTCLNKPIPKSKLPPVYITVIRPHVVVLSSPVPCWIQDPPNCVRWCRIVPNSYRGSGSSLDADSVSTHARASTDSSLSWYHTPLRFSLSLSLSCVITDSMNIWEWKRTNSDYSFLTLKRN